MSYFKILGFATSKVKVPLIFDFGLQLRNGVFVDVPVSGFRRFTFHNFGTPVMKSLNS
jgi:hypothetical protein